MKYAIALGGGGAKGAYQIGVWKALRELDIEIETVLGTSVGAINAAAFAMGNYKQAKKLWKELDYSTVISLKKQQITSLKDIDIMGFTKDVFYKRGIDISPLRLLLEKFVKEQTIRESPIEFGIVTASLSNMKPYILFDKDIPDGQIVDYIMASAALPIFQKQEIDGHVFIDGGFYDNVPIKELIDRGHKNIIAVDISWLGVHKKYDSKKANVVYIKNSESLGGTLAFTDQLVKRNMLLGYLDAKLAMKQYIGQEYYIKEDNSKNKLLYPITQEEINWLFTPFKGYHEENIKKYILKTLRKHTGCKLTGGNTIIAAMEVAAEVLHIERLKEYTMEELHEEIMKEYRKLKKEGDTPLKELSKNLWKKKKMIFNDKAFSKMFTPFVIKDGEVPSILMLVTLPKLYITNLYIYLSLWRVQSK
ncbi:MAG: patatin-like phospholipase family protein [Clostridiales bacterium]|nr:patatin-like phospholipase family protein [Clostridiales bacterium]